MQFLVGNHTVLQNFLLYCTVKSHMFHGVGLDLCMKISFISTFLQYVIVQLVLAPDVHLSYGSYFTTV